MKWRPGRLALCELSVLVAVLGVAHLAAGEAQSGAGLTRLQSECRDCVRPPAARCPAAQQAISRYRRQYTASRTSMGLDGAPPRAWYPCHAARRRAVEWRDRAHQAARSLAQWKRDQYHWWVWMPRGSKWYRVASCETGYGGDPNWSHDSGTYVSAFGIYRPGYADDAHRIGNMSWDETVRVRGTVPTPREQYEAALSHYRAHGGFSGWGCRGA